MYRDAWKGGPGTGGEKWMTLETQKLNLVPPSFSSCFSSWGQRSRGARWVVTAPSDWSCVTGFTRIFFFLAAGLALFCAYDGWSLLFCYVAGE